MRIALLVLLAAAATARAGDEPRASIEVVASKGTVYVQEPLRLRLRFSFDAAYFRGHGIRTLQRELDVPAQIQAAWLRELPGALRLADAPPEGGAPRLTFALGEDVASAHPVTAADGRTVLEIERTYLPLRAGDLVVAAPALRFSHASRFTDDLLQGPVPIDRRDETVTGRAITVRVLPLPEAGRPGGFTGAVGRLTVRAETDRGEAAAGASMKLVLRVEGDGNLESFETPRLDELAGFHVFGAIDERQRARRTITYDVAPLSSGVTEVPPIPFVVFDTGEPAGWRTLRTAAIPLKVTGGRPDGPGSAAPGGAPRSAWPLVLAAAAAVAAALAIAWRRSRSAAPPPVPSALEAFRERTSRPGSDLAEETAAYVASLLGCASAAVIAPDLAARLAAAGAPADLAARTAALLERLVGGRYGGSADPAADLAAALALAEDLDKALRPARSRGA